MQDPLLDASKRVQRAWSADGLAEIATGLIFFLLALFAWAKAGFEHSDPLWRILNFAQVLVMLPGIQVVMWAVPRLRNRLFGDRQGIMIPRSSAEPRAKAVMTAVVAASMAVLLVIILRKNANWAVLTILGAGCGTALILCQIARAAGIRRYWILAAVIALASAGIAALGTDFETAFTRQFGFIGLLLMGSGVLSLVNFLHAPPRAPRMAG